MLIILITILILSLILSFPGAPWMSSYSYGYAPTGGLGFVLLILVVLALMGRV